MKFQELNKFYKKISNSLPIKLLSAHNLFDIFTCHSARMENFTEISSEPKKPNNYLGKILIGTSACVAVGISVVCFPFISPALRKFTLPFVPATDSQLRNIMKVLPKDSQVKVKVLDIGSGDGRIVIEAAKRG